MTQEFRPPGDPPEHLKRRAAQLDALTEPIRLLALSFMAQEEDHALSTSNLARLMHLSEDELEAHVEVLLDRNLVSRMGDVLVLSLDSWQHFRSVMAPRSGPEGLPTGIPVTREVDWSRYPTVVRRISEQLALRFRTTFSQRTVQRYVAESYDELASRSQVSRHLPMLTNRLATDRLSGIAAARGITLRPVPSLLFVCVRNAGRSQLAMAWAKHLAGDIITVASAGSAPAVSLDPVVLLHLEEEGLGSPTHSPRDLTDEAVRGADVVVTMGCGDACPVIPGRRYFDWEVPDPAGQPIEVVREISADIRTRVDSLLIEFGIEA